jgi:hypothetical protein
MMNQDTPRAMLVGLSVEKYRPGGLWDVFVSSIDCHFMFTRTFMDYHSDRFNDASLILKCDEEVIALFPANRRGRCLQSHGGLSFGGLLHAEMSSGAQVLRMMAALVEHARMEGYQQIAYKRVPWIYHSAPAEADAYALHRLGFGLERRDLSSAIPLDVPTRLSKGRKHALGKARKAGLSVALSTDYEGFHLLLAEVLRERHQLEPVHSAAEIRLLSERFPDNIKLLGLTADGEWLAGAWLFITSRVCHTQYLAASGEGRTMGAMDLVITSAIEMGRNCGCHYLSFGISTEQNGSVLNEGLLSFKEMFGGAPLCHDQYMLNL